MAAVAGTPQNPITISHPLLLLPPITPPTNTPLTSLTLFWSTISTLSTFAALTSLSSTPSFNSLSSPYTNPIIILTSLLTATLHFLLFFNLHRIPTLPHHALESVELCIDTAGLLLWVVLIRYPEENSVEVAVFTVALAVDMLAITKLVNPRRDGKLFNRLISVAIYRVLCAFPGWDMYGRVWALMIYGHIVFTEILFRNQSMFQNLDWLF